MAKSEDLVLNVLIGQYFCITFWSFNEFSVCNESTICLGMYYCMHFEVRHLEETSQTFLLVHWKKYNISISNTNNN